MLKTAQASGARPRRQGGSQSKIERLNTEAQTILSQKADEIAKLESSIEEAEKELVKLKAEYGTKVALATAEEAEEDLDDDEIIDLQKLKEEHDNELRERNEQHEEEISAMKLKFTRALKDAEAWAEEHAENVYAEKSAQLESLKQELNKIKSEVNEEMISQTQSRNKMYHRSKTIAFQNHQRIQFLQAQLSEISSVTREELRDVRQKIDECLSAVEIREREHKNEIERYEREITQREERYNTHLQCLEQQFKNEKQRLDQQYQAAVEKGENLQRVLKQLEKHHDMQMQTTIKDNERMKNTIYQAQTRDDQAFTDTRSYVSQIQSTQHATRQVEQEIAVVNEEIAELQAENKELQDELKRLQSGTNIRRSLYSRR